MKWFRLVLKRFVTLLISLLVLAGGVWFWYHHRRPPEPTGYPLFAGIHYAREVWRTPRPVVIHLVRIDLQTPGLRFGVTPGDPTRKLPLDARTTSAYLKEAGAQVAINADFFHPWVSNTPWDYYPHVGDPVTVEGRACARGNCYGNTPWRSRFPSLLLSRNNRAMIGWQAPRDFRYNVVSGNEVILLDGRLAADGKALQPRTAVGLDKARRHLFLIVVDGRQPHYSEGVTIPELAAILRRQGADTALNLDGGGSTTLAVQGDNGEPQVLNCPIDNHIPGRERPVANHLAVFVPPR